MDRKLVSGTISKSKTKTLRFGETESVIHLDSEMVAPVDHFRYLGSEVISSGRLNKELSARIGRASATRIELLLVL